MNMWYIEHRSVVSFIFSRIETMVHQNDGRQGHKGKRWNKHNDNACPKCYCQKSGDERAAC